MHFKILLLCVFCGATFQSSGVNKAQLTYLIQNTGSPDQVQVTAVEYMSTACRNTILISIE